MSKKSIINLHAGQTGVQIGRSLWDLYLHEHNIDMEGKRTIEDNNMDEWGNSELDNFKTFFYETAAGRYVPKAVFVDSEPGVMDNLRTSPLGGLVYDLSMINQKQDCRNNMGLGWYSEFSDTVHRQIPEAIRRMRESCDEMSGFMHFLSGSGGSGTGYTCRALEWIRDEQPKSINHSQVVLPSPTISGCPLETFNAITYLGLIRFDQLYMNINTIFDNEALYRQSIKLCKREYNQFVPTYYDINCLIAIAMSSATASIRWDGQLNVDLQDYQVNLVPYPTMHHLYHTNAPLHNDDERDRTRVVDLTLQAFRKEAHCVSLDTLGYVSQWAEQVEQEIFEEAVYKDEHTPWVGGEDAVIKDNCYNIKHGMIGCCLMYRGDVKPVRVNQSIRALNSTLNPYFVSWVPNGYKIGINSPPMSHPKHWAYKNTSRQLTSMINSTCIMEKFKHLCTDYYNIMELEGYDCWFDLGEKLTCFSKDMVDSCRDGLLDLIIQYESACSRSMNSEDMRDAMEETPGKISAY